MEAQPTSKYCRGRLGAYCCFWAWKPAASGAVDREGYGGLLQKILRFRRCEAAFLLCDPRL